MPSYRLDLLTPSCLKKFLHRFEAFPSRTLSSHDSRRGSRSGRPSLASQRPRKPSSSGTGDPLRAELGWCGM